MSVAPIAKKPVRVLVADDERNMRTTLASILGREGHDVCTAANGEEAVELCKSEGFDVIFMDVRMPGIDGVEAFRRIRRLSRRMRVIMMSAFSMDEMKEAALEQGAIAFLSKPLDIERAIKLVDEVKDTTILVVEDDEDAIRFLGAVLSEHGYRVTVTRSPHDALTLVEQIRFDLIFIAAKLPSMNGLDLCTATKKINPTAVAIMITGMEDEFDEIARETMHRCDCAMVRKPLHVDDILNLLDRYPINGFPVR